MLHDTPCKHETKSLLMDWDKVEFEFSLEGEGTKVSMHAIHASLSLIPTSWETTVTSQTLDIFVLRETSFLT